jgi:hypothetical protein
MDLTCRSRQTYNTFRSENTKQESSNFAVDEIYCTVRNELNGQRARYAANKPSRGAGNTKTPVYLYLHEDPVYPDPGKGMH